MHKESGLTFQNRPRPPQLTSIKGLMVSSRWYLGFLTGQLGGCWDMALEPYSSLMMMYLDPLSSTKQQEIGTDVVCSESSAVSPRLMFDLPYGLLLQFLCSRFSYT